MRCLGCILLLVTLSVSGINLSFVAVDAGQSPFPKPAIHCIPLAHSILLLADQRSRLDSLADLIVASAQAIEPDLRQGRGALSSPAIATILHLILLKKIQQRAPPLFRLG